MGHLISRVLDLFCARNNVRLLMVGLDAAGKTTILYKLRLGRAITTVPTILNHDTGKILYEFPTGTEVTTIPTLGVNVETIEYRNINFTVHDIGGHDKIRPLWHYYYQNTTGVIFVVDSNDTNRIDKARDELHYLMAQDELQDAVLLVFANKQDMVNAMSVTEMTDKLGLHELRRSWYIQSCSALSGDGLYEGLGWLASTLKRKQ